MAQWALETMVQTARRGKDRASLFYCCSLPATKARTFANCHRMFIIIRTRTATNVRMFIIIIIIRVTNSSLPRMQTAS